MFNDILIGAGLFMAGWLTRAYVSGGLGIVGVPTLRPAVPQPPALGAGLPALGAGLPTPPSASSRCTQGVLQGLLSGARTDHELALVKEALDNLLTKGAPK